MAKGFIHLGGNFLKLFRISRVHGLYIRSDTVHQFGIHGIDTKASAVGGIVLLKDVGRFGSIGSG